jgi:hypothetical protein
MRQREAHGQVGLFDLPDPLVTRAVCVRVGELFVGKIERAVGRLEAQRGLSVRELRTEIRGRLELDLNDVPQGRRSFARPIGPASRAP